MTSIKAIRYIDASYFLKKVVRTEVSNYICVGKIKKRKDDIVVVFSEHEGKPREGLIVPLPLLNIVENKQIGKSYKKYINNTVGIFWHDVTYFRSGSVPSKATVMYTEGILTKESGKSVTIKKPLTLLVNKRKAFNHPQSSQPIMCSIPKITIKSIDVYENRKS
jgi:hypothetical protein